MTTNEPREAQDFYKQYHELKRDMEAMYNAYKISFRDVESKAREEGKAQERVRCCELLIIMRDDAFERYGKEGDAEEASKIWAEMGAFESAIERITLSVHYQNTING